MAKELLLWGKTPEIIGNPMAFVERVRTLAEESPSKEDLENLKIWLLGQWGGINQCISKLTFESPLSSDPSLTKPQRTIRFSEETVLDETSSTSPKRQVSLQHLSSKGSIQIIFTSGDQDLLTQVSVREGIFNPLETKPVSKELVLVMGTPCLEIKKL